MLAILFVVVARIPRRDTASRPPTRSRAQLPGASSYPHSVAQFEVLSPSPTRAPRARAVNLPRALCTPAALKKATQATAARSHAHPARLWERGLFVPDEPRAHGETR